MYYVSNGVADAMDNTLVASCVQHTRSHTSYVHRAPRCGAWWALIKN